MKLVMVYVRHFLTENILLHQKALKIGYVLQRGFKMNGTSPIALEPLMVNIFAWNALEMVALHFIITKIFTVYLVLMAVCDANYCFTMIDVGGFGRDNDASILNESEFGQAFEKYQSELNIPSPELVENLMLPYVLLGDDIFGLNTWLMKPYPGKCLLEDKRIYSYRHSRAKRTIENSFGILSAKWRIFRRPIRAGVDTVEKIIKAAVCLHNYLRQTDTANYTPAGFVDSENGDGDIIPGNWRNTVQNEGSSLMSLNHSRSNRSKFDATKIRNDFKSYFNSPQGAVAWQYKHVRSCGEVNM